MYQVGTKSVKQCVEFYYIWKKVCEDDYRLLCQARKQHLSSQLNPFCTSTDTNGLKNQGMWTRHCQSTWNVKVTVLALFHLLLIECWFDSIWIKLHFYSAVIAEFAFWVCRVLSKYFIFVSCTFLLIYLRFVACWIIYCELCPLESGLVKMLKCAIALYHFGHDSLYVWCLFCTFRCIIGWLMKANLRCDLNVSVRKWKTWLNCT